MGGIGSGRQGGRGTTGAALALDLAKLKPGGHSYSWSLAGERVGSVGYDLNAVQLVVQYSRKGEDGELRHHIDRLSIVTTPAGFGGERRWLQCGCGRRCRVVYVGRYGTRCRLCYRLTYQSQRENLAARAQRRAGAMARRMGADADAPFDWFPPRPKRMHWNRYWRLEEQHRALVELEDRARFAYAAQLVMGRRWGERLGS